MRSLGFSIYLDHGSDEEILSYIDLAAKYDFKRVFMCFLSLDNGEETIKRFKKIVEYANSKDMFVIADVSNQIFETLDISIHDLSFFKELGLAGIRLDYGFNAMEEAIMTQNKLGLKIELNMSMGPSHLETIMNYDPNLDNLRGSHNFYPHRYTGLDQKHFNHCSTGFKAYSLHTSAFVNSENARFGPWPVEEGLCTLESHRELPIDVQTKDLFSTNWIDEVIIANEFASEDDFRKLSELNPYRLSFKLKLNDNISELEKEIIEKHIHRNRGDVSSFMIRSSDTRAVYKGRTINPNNTYDIKPGDVLIDNSLYTKYAGEVQIAKKAMKNSGKTNVVGSIVDEELFLLERVGPNQTFTFDLD